MYRVDALVRIFNGEDPTGIKGYSELPTPLLTPDNIAKARLTAEGDYVGVPGYLEHFAKLWKANC